MQVFLEVTENGAKKKKKKNLSAVSVGRNEVE